MSEQQAQQPEEQGQIYWQEPETKPPPLLAVGAIAWVRDNLFSSVLDAALTILGALLAIGALTSFLMWSVRAANWFVITFNFRQFMLGRLEPTYEWRIIVLVLFVALVTGFAIAAYVRRLSIPVLAVTAIILALVFFLPVAINSTIPLDASYLAAGNVGIVSGTAEELPQERLAFIAAAGDTINIRIDTADLVDDQSMSLLHGFADVASNTLINAAGNRLDTIQRVAEIEAILAEDTALIESTGRESGQLTSGQRQSLTEELEKLEIAEVITDTYAVNDTPITVQILDSQTMEPLSEAVTLSTAEDNSFSYEIPADGWYVLQKQAADGAEGATILEANGIYPILESAVFRTSGEGDAEAGDEASAAPGQSSELVNSYIRMTDNLSIEQPIPVDEAGDEIPFAYIVNNQYRGERTLSAYLRVYLAPFLSVLSNGTFMMTVLAIVGFFAARIADRRLSPAGNPQQASRRYATWLLIAAPVVMAIMIRGLTLSEVMLISMLAAWFVYVLLAYQIGTFLRLRRGSDWPSEISRMLNIIIMLVPGFVLILIAPWLMSGMTNSISSVDVGLAVVVSIFAFMGMRQGTDEAGADPKENRQQLTQRLILAIVLYAVPVIVMVMGLLGTAEGGLISGPLALTDPRRWGGFLLTMILTVFGIIFAFPLGVALALGRRSSLPAVRAICTLYIELVRGAPLITVLFMMQLLIPLIHPTLADIPNAIRALIAVFLFSAAYLAENVRGGLQSIPPGQEEAARAVGLSNWQVIRFITMPQALRAVIPALVGQFISLFKDTSLVAIVGLIDLTGFVNTVVVQSAFIGLRREALLFITIIYFVFSYVMSYVSRRIEESGSGSARRI